MKGSSYKKYNLIYTIILLGISNSTMAQESTTEHQAGITIGAVSNRDTLLAGNKLKGRSVAVNYSLTRIGEKRRTGINITYTGDRYNNTDGAVKVHQFDLQFTDGYRIAAKLRNPAVYLGYNISSHSAYAAAGSDRIFSWNSYNMIGLYQSTIYKWKDQSVSLDINIPVAGVVYRNPAGQGSINESKAFNEVLSSLYDNPVFGSFHNNRAADISLNYSKKISSRLLMGIHYKLSYRNWQGDNPSQFSSNALGVSISLLPRKM